MSSVPVERVTVEVLLSKLREKLIGKSLSDVELRQDSILLVFDNCIGLVIDKDGTVGIGEVFLRNASAKAEGPVN